MPAAWRLHFVDEVQRQLRVVHVAKIRSAFDDSRVPLVRPVNDGLRVIIDIVAAVLTTPCSDRTRSVRSGSEPDGTDRFVVDESRIDHVRVGRARLPDGRLDVLV